VIHVASGREWRGGQRQVWLLARGLAHATAVETSVLTGLDTRLAHVLHDAGVPVLPVRWHAGLDPRVLSRLVRSTDRATILHAHDGHAHALADIAARMTGARVVITRRMATAIRAPRRFQRAAAVITLSGAISEQVAACGVPAHRIHQIPPAVDLAALSPPPPWPATIPAPSEDAPLIVAIAALTREKGIDVLLDAAARLHRTHPALRWLVMGDGAERPALLAQRARLGLEGVVDLPGSVTRPEGALPRATLLVQSSRHEGFGSVVLEALALGVPVVASAVGGLPDALAGGGGILVPPEQPVALASAIAGLLTDQERRGELGTAGRAAAAGFSVDLLVQRTLDVYRSLDLYPGA
jgi:glycosyltransferase involved in cell wall biosynthesis